MAAAAVAPVSERRAVRGEGDLSGDSGVVSSGSYEYGHGSDIIL